MNASVTFWITRKHTVLYRKQNGFPKLFILRAFTKTYAMAGLRLGYGICADRGLLRRLSAGRQP